MTAHITKETVGDRKDKIRAQYLWIQVGPENMPEDLLEVLCYNGNYRHTGYYNERLGIWYHSNGNKVDVDHGWAATHWMPLPAPPKS